MSSMPTDGPAAVSLSTADGRSVVQFVLNGDRFLHRVFVDGQTTESASTESVDKDMVEGEEDWPRSPPIQQLSEEVVDGRTVILGVGSAGRSHWSVSVQPVEIEDGHALKFEWACRHKVKPAFIGTTYRHTASIRVIAEGNATLESCDANTSTICPNEISNSGTDCWSYLVAAESHA